MRNVKEFGTFLRLKRTQRGLLTREFGLSIAAISMLEANRRSPTYKSLTKIAKAFGMPTWELMKEFETGGRNS